MQLLHVQPIQRRCCRERAASGAPPLAAHTVGAAAQGLLPPPQVLLPLQQEGTPAAQLQAPYQAGWQHKPQQPLAARRWMCGMGRACESARRLNILPSPA